TKFDPDALAGSSIADTRRTLARRFLAHGIDNPGLDARMLIGHALGLSHTDLVLRGARIVTREEAFEVNALAQRRLAGEPVARIVGEKAFWGLSLKLDAGVVIPPPETETGVDGLLPALPPGLLPGR